jgi:hypothetical protein
VSPRGLAVRGLAVLFWRRRAERDTEAPSGTQPAAGGMGRGEVRPHIPRSCTLQQATAAHHAGPISTCMLRLVLVRVAEPLRT